MPTFTHFFGGRVPLPKKLQQKVRTLTSLLEDLGVLRFGGKKWGKTRGNPRSRGRIPVVQPHGSPRPFVHNAFWMWRVCGSAVEYQKNTTRLLKKGPTGRGETGKGHKKRTHTVFQNLSHQTATRVAEGSGRLPTISWGAFAAS